MGNDNSNTINHTVHQPHLSNTESHEPILHTKPSSTIPTNARNVHTQPLNGTGGQSKRGISTNQQGFNTHDYQHHQPHHVDSYTHTHTNPRRHSFVQYPAHPTSTSNLRSNPRSRTRGSVRLPTYNQGYSTDIIFPQDAAHQILSLANGATLYEDQVGDEGIGSIITGVPASIISLVTNMMNTITTFFDTLVSQLQAIFSALFNSVGNNNTDDGTNGDGNDAVFFIR